MSVGLAKFCMWTTVDSGARMLGCYLTVHHEHRKGVDRDTPACTDLSICSRKSTRYLYHSHISSHEKSGVCQEGALAIRYHFLAKFGSDLRSEHHKRPFGRLDHDNIN